MNNKSNIQDEFPDYEKCPNCEEYTYHNGICRNCGIGLADKFDNKNSVKKQKKKTKSDIVNTLEEQKIKLNVNFLNYSSYSVIVKNWKIHKICFMLAWKSFKISINYDIINTQIIETIFHETEKDERKRILNIQKLINLKIYWIQAKVKVWYDEIKHINYYKFIDKNINHNIMHFIMQVIKKYHNI